LAKTYGADPSDGRDWLRLILADTEVGTNWSITAYYGAVFTDSEIDALIAAIGIAGAGAQLAQAKASRYGALVGKLADADMSEDITAQIAYFNDLAKKLRSGELVPPGEAGGGIAVVALDLPDLQEYKTD